MSERRPLSTPTFVAALAAIAVGAAALWIVLFVAFGEESEDVGTARRVEAAFAADGSGPGPSDRGPALEVVSGGFERADGTLVAAEATGDDPALATVSLRAARGQVAATAATAPAGWGLAFRADGPDDFWYVAAGAPGQPSVLGVVEGGENRPLAELDRPITAGARVEVRFDHRRADVRIDGVLVGHARGEQVTGLRAGVVASAPGAAWDDLEMGPPTQPALVTDG